MKNLFKFSDFYFTLLVLVFALASCHKRELSQTGMNSKKLEKLSAELENSTVSNYLASIPYSEELNAEEQTYTPIMKKISKTSFKNNGKKGVVHSFKESEHETIRVVKKQELRNETNNVQLKVNRGGLTQRMKLGIILASVGLLVALLLPWPISVLGLIAFIIGAVFIIIELVNY